MCLVGWLSLYYTLINQLLYDKLKKSNTAYPNLVCRYVYLNGRYEK